MRRGELYLIHKPGSHDSRKEDPRKQRVFVIASRQSLLATRYSTVICAPVYSQHDGISTQVLVGIQEGLKKDSSIHCDELVSVPRSLLTHYVGALGEEKSRDFDRALSIALGLA